MGNPFYLPHLCQDHLQLTSPLGEVEEVLDHLDDSPSRAEDSKAQAGEEDQAGRVQAKEQKVSLIPAIKAKEAVSCTVGHPSPQSARSLRVMVTNSAMEAARTTVVNSETDHVIQPAHLSVQCPTQTDPLGHLPPFQRLRACFSWWKKHAAPFVCNLIKKGVEPNFKGHQLQIREQKKSEEEVLLAQEVMKDYVEAKAAKEVNPQGTKYLVPWFVIQKMEPSGKMKNRLISDCRIINKELNPPKFKLDHWKEIFPHLEKGMWATKVDLKNAYFHLELSKAIKPFIRMKIGEKIYQMEGACFGLSTLPYLWMEVMQVFLKKWRKQGMLVFIYLDDILLLARSEVLVRKQTAILMQDLKSSGMMINHKKSQTQPSQQVEHLGFQIDLNKGVLQVPTPKLKTVRKELGKFLTQNEMTCRKAAAILGQLRSFLTALPCLRAFSDQLVKLTEKQTVSGWDQKIKIPPELKEQVKDIGVLLREWQGRRFAGKNPDRKSFSDSSTQGWGALDLNSGQKLHEFWRSEKGLHINIKELKAAIAAVQSLAHPGETVFLSIDNQVAYSYLKKGGKTDSLQQLNATISNLVLSKQRKFDSKLGKVRRNASRQHKSLGNRQGRLHPKKRHISKNTWNFFHQQFSTNGGHVQQPRKCPITKICLQVATQPKCGHQCFRMQPGTLPKGLLEPTLEINSALANQAETESTYSLSSNSSNVGWECLVAPVHQAPRPKIPCSADKTDSGDVLELPGRADAPPKVVPSLCSVIREGLQRKQISAENIENNLKQIKSLKTYDKAFQALWIFCQERGGDPLTMTPEEAASWILRFAQQKPHQARNAYSAFLHIPGWEYLKFSPIIRQAKKFWSLSGAKCADFWDASSVVRKLQAIPLDLNDIRQVRDRAIIVLRLFHLCRSVDLSQALRITSKCNRQRFWKLKRKGKPRAEFEALVSLPDCTVSPSFLLSRYVNLTKEYGKPGGAMFLSLNPPYRPLTANSIGRITKEILSAVGVPVSVFGAHSTRGAAVKMLKEFGLSSEVVCELGAWKNGEAFSKHYLRINAAKKASSVLVNKFVHKVPSCRSAEKGRSRIPGTDKEPGRKDLTCEAQMQDGPTQPPQEQDTETGGGPLLFRFTDPANCRRRQSSKEATTPRKTKKQ